jgi:cyclase
LAVQNPDIIRQGARAFGNQCIVLGMDAKKSERTDLPSGYEVYVQGGRKAMGLDAVAWARQAVALGVGEICVNSIDADGTKNGYEINLTRQIAEAVDVPIIASGGAGIPNHLVEVFKQGKADAGLVASMVHYGTYRIADIKKELALAGIPVRHA